MQQAKNIDDLANNLIPEQFLERSDKDFYIPIFEDILDELRDNIINDKIAAQTFFVAGQSGNGKTTALNFLENEDIKKHYYTRNINMRDFLDVEDADIIDFLLTFAFALVKDTALEKDYYKQLVEIQKQHRGEIIKEIENEKGRKGETGMDAGTSIGGGFLDFIKLKAGFFANYRLDSLYREKTREIFKTKAPVLLELINKLIEQYIEKVTQGKNLLVIIDDLDKLQEINQIDSIFLENRQYIFNIKCKKVISIPTYLTTASKINTYIQYPIPQFVIKLRPNPIDKTVDKGEEKKEIGTNRKMFKQVISVRIAGDIELINQDALETAVDFSGGIIRQLVSIVRQAAIRVRRLKGKKISSEDILDAIGTLSNSIARTIVSTDKIGLLAQIHKKNKPVSGTSALFLELLHANNILAYQNGNVWYEINPLIKKTIEIYAEEEE